MLLIAILIALLAERLAPDLAERRSLGAFERYVQWVQTRRGLSAPLALLLALAPWVVAVALLQALLSGVLWGLLELVLGSVVLFLALCPGSLDPAVDAYVAARERKDEATARHQAEHILGGSAPLGVEEEVRAVADALLLQANERWLAPLFWFVLLGPVGAALYRLTVHTQTVAHEDGLQHAARWLRGALDWIPVRMLAALYTLSGSFEDGLQAWRQQGQVSPEPPSPQPSRADELEQGNRDVLLRVGRGALRTEDYAISAEVGESGEIEVDASIVRTARGLVLRAIIIFVAAVALLTLGDWVQ